ncbi:hypothetical protein [Candidatus Spongiihabitans sp.]|uniref:hypothetical protein n=1 Tax=Candidatus Spongiihabitans sp. TaxID=3101308 RepID=UPI003C6F5C2B
MERLRQARQCSRYECCPLYEGRLTVTAINQERVHYPWPYNHYRPHDSLDLMTPMAYYRQLALAT